jgi:DNA repair protein RecO (recombination protein O)
MLQRVSLQPCYLLHSRPYRDTSVLADVLSRDHGRISLVARGVRGTRSSSKGLLQPFVPLLISWVGKSDLMTLTQVEANGRALFLQGDSLLSGIYMNELLIRVLERCDPYPKVYESYAKTLADLEENKPLQPTLRSFEKYLLQELGYALSLEREAESGLLVDADAFYHFNPLHGLTRLALQAAPQDEAVFSGQSLLALQADVLDDAQHLRDAKRLIRLALEPLLGNKPLRSRELFAYVR